jgi:hypothetical protein
MRCLQCGVEMALLKKLRNSTEFCSDECRQKYQDESNQLAVSRLMQQRKQKPARAAGSATGVAERPRSTPVAVVAITEPPLAEFLPQTAIAEIEVHPVTSKVDWQSRKGNQVLPALADDVLNSLLALQFTQIQEQYAPRGPRPGLIDDFFLLSPPSLWSQAIERQALPAPAPNLTQTWSAAWPAEWRGLIDLVRENSETAESAVTEAGPAAAPAPPATVAAPIAPIAPVPPAAATPLAPAATAAPTSLTPPAAAPLKVAKPTVVPAEPAEPSPVIETVAMPQPALRTPETTMLPLRPRIAIAPRVAEPEAPKQEKAPPVKPILVPKPAEASKVSESPKRAEAKAAAQAAPAKPADKPKPGEGRIPEVRLETRRPEKSPVEDSKPVPATQAKGNDTKPAEPKGKEPKAVESKPDEAPTPLAAPTFGAPAKGSAATGLWHRMPWWERCAAVAVFLLSIGGWLINGRPAEDKRSSRPISLPSPAAPAPGMGSDSWASERATDLAGVALNRQLSLYRPSKTMKDYVVEFQGTIQERALGWIVRAKDASNYYCLKLEVDKAGAAKLIRFGVINGKEDAHTQLPLSMLPKPENGAYKVRVEAKGPKISTYINGQAVDVWVDERIPQGAAGFTNERSERAVVKSVQVSF